MCVARCAAGVDAFSGQPTGHHQLHELLQLAAAQPAPVTAAQPAAGAGASAAPAVARCVATRPAAFAASQPAAVTASQPAAGAGASAASAVARCIAAQPAAVAASQPTSVAAAPLAAAVACVVWREQRWRGLQLHRASAGQRQWRPPVPNQSAERHHADGLLVAECVCAAVFRLPPGFVALTPAFAVPAAINATINPQGFNVSVLYRVGSIVPDPSVSATFPADLSKWNVLISNSLVTTAGVVATTPGAVSQFMPAGTNASLWYYFNVRRMCGSMRERVLTRVCAAGRHQAGSRQRQERQLHHRANQRRQPGAVLCGAGDVADRLQLW